MSILHRLGFDLGKARTASTDDRAETRTVRAIVAALDRLDPDRARYIATFACILSRVARADLSIDDAETHEMERKVAAHGGLPESQAILVVQMAKTQNILFGGTENFLVSREFGKMATHEQKLRLLQCLFSVSAADDSISVAEDNEVRRISRELRLSHRDFIEARRAYRDRLAVLKSLPDGRI
jgi:uncharacterized tellurite resistance protein B-like protein